MCLCHQAKIFVTAKNAVSLLRQESKGKQIMLREGTRVKMTKGYRGVQGTIALKTDSKLELYVIALENGLRIVAGPSAFVLLEA